MNALNDSWDNVERINVAPALDWNDEPIGDVASLDTEFDAGYGGTNGCRFTVWTHDYVYFPIQYDGAEWTGFAPRNPCDVAMKHQGGG